MINYTKEYLRFIKWVFNNPIDCLELIPDYFWKNTIKEEQDSLLFGYYHTRGRK